jgi:hypothetical protein
MIALRRVVAIIEWLLTALFALALTMVLLDLPFAWKAEPCSLQPISGCYPWGGEGPAYGG